LVLALAEPPRLTARERHVAALAAAGLTNRAVAERLGLSRRTVENHLNRAYAKLGVPGRAHLAARLAEDGR
jgi:DNA-binding CsgD family transcriptional regulator